MQMGWKYRKLNDRQLYNIIQLAVTIITSNVSNKNKKLGNIKWLNKIPMLTQQRHFIQNFV